MEIKLRPYQQELIQKVRASYASGKRAPLLVLSTGGGKTYCFSYMSKQAVARGRRVLILVHKTELLDQASRSLSNLGVDHGRISPGHSGERSQVAVASVQTLVRRILKQRISFDFVIIDEAHHANASTYLKILAHFPQAHILGVTATPCRSDGSGLGTESGGIFDDLIEGPTVEELIGLEALVRPKVYAPPTDLDLSGIKRRGGDYDKAELNARVDKPTITGSAVEHYAKISPFKPAIAFCASLKHAEHVRDSFRSAGFKSELIHGGLKDDVRSQMIKDLGSGRIHVLTSVDLISEGTDIPIVSTGILLRPTQSKALYIQQVGRVLRTAPSKTQAIILDHVGNCLKHGLPTDRQEWSLKGEKRSKRFDDREIIRVRQCKKCFAVWEEGLACPYCGHVNIIEARKPKEVEGELREVSEEEIKRLQIAKRREVGMAKTFEELLKIEKERGYKPGWAHFRWNARKNR